MVQRLHLLYIYGMYITLLAVFLVKFYEVKGSLIIISNMTFGPMYVT